MIKITINGKKYKGVYSWDDLSLSKFCEVAAIPMPEGYESYILADGKFTPDKVDEYVEAVSQITEDQLKAFPVYYRKVISCLTNIPDSLEIPTERVEELYEYYLKPFIVSLLYHVPVINYFGQIKQYEPVKCRSFNIGLQTFRLPDTVRILDQDIPLANESILTYSEASDIFRGMKISKDDVNRLALFMAIYCRKKGEAYDEKKVLERKDLFMKAPMSVVWSVFFCTIRRLPDYSMITLLYGSLPKSIREVVHQAQAYHVTVREG